MSLTLQYDQRKRAAYIFIDDDNLSTTKIERVHSPEEVSRRLKQFGLRPRKWYEEYWGFEAPLRKL